MPGPIDWLVLTAANRRQAKAYASQVAARAEHGALARVRGMLVVPDACDKRIGSGAATVLALVQVARQIVAGGKKAASLEEIFAGERILMLHSGGDSRRLPMYAAEGKLFASLPEQGAGARCASVFDVLVRDLLSLAPRDGGEVLVAAGDAVVGIARDPVRFEGDGVIGVAQRAGVERAMRHGVFVCARTGEEVADFLQKPGEPELRRADALARDGMALVDTGLLSFDPQSVAALLKGAGVRLARSGEINFAAQGLADLASRAELPAVDLYREILMALPAPASRAAYLDACGPGALAKPLGAHFDAMRGVRFRVKTTRASEFLHVGSTREMLEGLAGTKPACRAFGIGGDWPVRGNALVLDGFVRGLALASGRAVLDRVAVGALELGGENVVVGVDAEELALPRGISLVGVPQLDDGIAFVACTADDDFKTPLARGGTVLGMPLDEWTRRAKTTAGEVVSGDGTLWDARLWCVGPSKDPLALVRWMWEGGAAPEAWRKADRLSMREIVEQADLEEIAARRDSFARAAMCSEPMRALSRAVDAADARAIHEALLDQGEMGRLVVLQRGATELHAIDSPILRAHAAATLSEVAGAGTEHGVALRGVAFRSVGEAVLSRLELPAKPRAAAIIHDQAVWTSTPVRVDLAGGWSDTPPICNEVGGSVVNVAVTLRGQLPIQVVAKLEEEPVIRITSTDAGQTREIRTMEDLAERGDPSRWSSLAESALVLTGIAPSDPKASLKKWLEKTGGGVSLTMFSAVPKGSGLGTSSILGAATIQCLDRVLGVERTPSELFAATSALEQMLSTRGGWQDQAGGVLGGFKIVRSQPGDVQQPVAEPIAVPAPLLAELGARSLLYFTGERRMAKNILENVVWNWLVREPSAVKAIDRLRANAERMRAALASGDADATVAQLAEYMKRKRQIDPGSCPKSFDALAERWSRELAAWCFAGAGGGGFMLLVAKDARHAEALRTKIERDPPHARARSFDFAVDPVGLRCAVL